MKVKRREPLMIQNIIASPFKVSISLAEICCEQLFHKGFCIRRENFCWEGKPPIQDLLVDSHRLCVNKRRLTDQHLIQQNSKRPPIHRFSMALIQQNLGRYVFWGA